MPVGDVARADHVLPATGEVAERDERILRPFRQRQHNQPAEYSMESVLFQALAEQFPWHTLKRRKAGMPALQPPEICDFDCPFAGFPPAESAGICRTMAAVYW